MTDLRGNETAQEFRIANSKRGPWDILGYVTVEDCDKLIAEYHSSQMSGIAQRAAEKIVARLVEQNFWPKSPDAVIHAHKEFAAIISQEGR